MMLSSSSQHALVSFLGGVGDALVLPLGHLEHMVAGGVATMAGLRVLDEHMIGGLRSSLADTHPGAALAATADMDSEVHAQATKKKRETERDWLCFHSHSYVCSLSQRLRQG